MELGKAIKMTQLYTFFLFRTKTGRETFAQIFNPQWSPPRPVVALPTKKKAPPLVATSRKEEAREEARARKKKRLATGSQAYFSLVGSAR